MRMLWPPPAGDTTTVTTGPASPTSADPPIPPASSTAAAAGRAGAPDAVDPLASYAADPRPAPADRPWVMVNMVASADGSATGAEGVSGDLGSPGDKAVFTAVRSVADVIVAGAATVIAEDYGPSHPSPAVTRRRLARGQAARPRIAVVSASLRLDPDRRLFTEPSPDARPIVLTTANADPDRRRALDAVADVHTAGDDAVDWRRALDVLAAAGARVVLCEGGPRVVAQLVALDLVDELCLTVAPVLVAGPGPRIAHAPEASPARPLILDRVLTEDGFLFLRYVRPQSAG
ncbi:MAG: pyrimidine reductase family protein [Acidimicrobiales bacterium]